MQFCFAVLEEREESAVPVTLPALQDQVLLSVVPVADGAGGQAGAGGALGVVVLPLASWACGRSSTVSAPHTPATQHPQASARRTRATRGQDRGGTQCRPTVANAYHTIKQM